MSRPAARRFAYDRLAVMMVRLTRRPPEQSTTEKDAMMAASLQPSYDDDFFAWTQDQANALRQIPKGAAGNRVDIARVAEEIEDLGKRDLREVESYLVLLFEHLMKIRFFPESIDRLHWRTEARRFCRGATTAFSPSMNQSIDVERIWQRARKAALEFLDDVDRRPSIDPNCAFALDEVVTDAFDLDAALAKIGEAHHG